MIWTLALAGLLLIGGFVTPPAALAAHDQGYICYVCHSLNPAELRTGSNSIRTDQSVLATVPPANGAWTGGMPVSCDFCHRSAGDIPAANMAGKLTKHPVDLIATGDTTASNEITCNDCHDNASQDLVSLTLTTKNTTDGYPDHKAVDNVYAHNLTNNPPHLNASWPYWGAQLPGVNRGTDCVFWTNVQAGTQNILCWRCHDGVSLSPYTNRRSSKNVKADYTDGNIATAKGHKIQTMVPGALGAGSALPCYDCHDSHGSVNRGMILDNNSIYNDCTSLLAVTTYNQGARPYTDLVVCAGCHDTRNTASAATKVAGVANAVEGMYPVDPYNSTATSALHIAAGIADVMTSSTKNCLTANSGCHSSPHNPVGESNGGQVCASCHGALYTGMRATTTYQHVMYDNTLTYPTAIPTNSGTDANRRCQMCHIDHDLFRKDINASSKGRGGNLRTAIGATPTTATNYDNTDYASGTGGLCLSCHTTTAQVPKNVTAQKPAISASTQIVVPAISAFDNSAHKYNVISTFGSDGSGFAANCTKCHNSDVDANAYNTLQISLHNATSGQLLSKFGRTTAIDNLEEGFCYGCHSEVGDLTVALGGKALNGRDYYGALGALMSTAGTEKTFKNFALRSKHPLAGNHSTTASVECENCHNPHVVRTALGSRVVNPDNTLALMAYSTTADNVAFCQACHDGTVPTYTNTAGTLIPYTVVIPAADTALMNKFPANGAGTRGHWNVTGSLQASTVKGCNACHDQHGATTLKLLGNYDPATGTSKIGATTLYNTATPVATDNANVCGACHAAAGLGYPAAGNPTRATITSFEGYRSAVAADNGYFNATPSGSVTTPRWPGMTVWQNATYSPHGVSAKIGPAALGSRGVADCNGCHDPHGTAYKWNMLTDNNAAGNYKLCFDCHTNGGIATNNIAMYFPTSVNGLWTGTDNNHGHRIRTAGGKLGVGVALPCYDCHVTHGSSKNNTHLLSDQRWNALGDTLSNDNASRVFCLGCHITSDRYDGYGNLIDNTDTIEGLPRAAGRPLTLPATVAAHASGQPGGCKGCHYTSTPYTDNNSNNAHNPSGGAACFGCHGDGSKRYWPQNAGTSPRVKTVAANYNYDGKHTLHLMDLAARLGVQTADNSLWNDNTQQTMCGYCHEVGADGSHMTNGPLAKVFNGTGKKTFWGTTDASGPTFDNGAFTCASVACHNEQTTTATYNWYTGSASKCVMCHTPSMAAPADNNPRSGLHAVTSAGVTKHDNTLATNGCTECHWTTGAPAHAPASKHINGTVDNAAVITATITRANMTFTDNAAANRGTCQGVGLSVAAGCHSDGGAWKRLWSTEADNTTSSLADSPRCNVCHGKWSTIAGSAGWRDNTAHFKVSNSSADARGKGHDGAPEDCDACHSYVTGSGSMRHDNASITRQINMNSNGSTFAVSGTRAGCSACHEGATGTANNHDYPLSVFPLNTVAGLVIPMPACDSCHDRNAAGTAPKVFDKAGLYAGRTTVYGSHLTRTTGEALSGSTNWDTQCKYCHAGHSGTAVTIPLPDNNYTDNNGGTALNMQTILGINYTANGGIHLGGTATVGTTEARICWNCHWSDVTLSGHKTEFGVNNNANTGARTYDYGSLSTANATDNNGWYAANDTTPATWTAASTSPSFAYKTAPLQSMHSTAMASGKPKAAGPGTKPVADLRCSYCHDVHDLNKATRTTTVGVTGTYIDNVTGQPYLRGTWRGNVYKEDGGPQSTPAIPASTPYQLVPRGNSTQTQLGGYWINQNSGGGDCTVLPNSAGLCVLCHNSDVNNMNIFGAPSASWVGTGNGHANSTVGGTGTVSGKASNIFDLRGGATGNSTNPAMRFSGGSEPGRNTMGFRGNSDSSAKWPPTASPHAYSTLSWGVTIDASTINDKYHQFICSKCHNPHASRLPRLMITNCLDTKHNQWATTVTVPTSANAQFGTLNRRRIPDWTSAQNCHRLTNQTDNATTGKGWNKVTPW